jgi:hypothetical protein
MNTQKETSHADIRLDAGPHNHQESVREDHKEKWLQKYACRILMAWSH